MVALTRAKEKLIVTSVQNQLDKKLSSYTSALTERQKISPYVARGAASYADWILMSLVFHLDFTKLCMELGCMPEDVVTYPECRFVPVVAKVNGTEEQNTGEELLFTQKPDQRLIEKIRECCTDPYPDKRAREIVTKLSDFAGRTRRASGCSVFQRTFLFKEGGRSAFSSPEGNSSCIPL